MNEVSDEMRAKPSNRLSEAAVTMTKGSATMGDYQCKGLVGTGLIPLLIVLKKHLIAWQILNAFGGGVGVARWQRRAVVGQTLPGAR